MDPIRPGTPLLASAMEKIRQALAGWIRWKLPSCTGSSGLEVFLDNRSDDGSFWATLSGSSSPYSFTQVHYANDPDPSTLTGTTNAYEVASISGLSGKVVRLHPGSDSPPDYRFAWTRLMVSPCTGVTSVQLCIKAVCQGSTIVISGVAVRIDDQVGGIQTGTTSSAGTACFTALPDHTYKVKLTKTGFFDEVDVLVTTTCTDSTAPLGMESTTYTVALRCVQCYQGGSPPADWVVTDNYGGAGSGSGAGVTTVTVNKVSKGESCAVLTIGCTPADPCFYPTTATYPHAGCVSLVGCIAHLAPPSVFPPRKTTCVCGCGQFCNTGVQATLNASSSLGTASLIFGSGDLGTGWYGGFLVPLTYTWNPYANCCSGGGSSNGTVHVFVTCAGVGPPGANSDWTCTLYGLACNTCGTSDFLIAPDGGGNCSYSFTGSSGGFYCDVHPLDGSVSMPAAPAFSCVPPVLPGLVVTISE